MLVRIRIAPVAAAVDEDRLFADVFIPSHRAWQAGLGSAVLHVLLLALIPQVALLLTPVPDFEWSKFEVKPLNVRVPLYFAEMSKPVPQRNVPRRDPGQAAPAEPSARSLPPPRVELPPAAVRKNAETVLLQPNVPMPNIQLTQMPALAFWARQEQAPPKLAKPFVSPGRTESPADEAQLDAPPSLAISNRQPKLSDLNMAALPPVNKPALPVQPSSTAPVRMPKQFKAPERQQATSIDAGQGDPANVIAFGAVPVPDKIVTVPPVTQAPSFGGESSPVVERPPARKEKPSNASANANGTGESKGDAPVKKSDTAKATTGTGGGTATGTPTASKTAPSATDAASSQTATEAKPDTSRTSAAVGAAAGMRSIPGSPVLQAAVTESAAATKPSPSATASTSSGSRFVQPRDGRFSFVVTGSADSYPEAKGVLGGKVVYTVSVRVGAPRDWILQYCLPKEIEHSLGMRATSVPLEAPYPFVMIRPPIHSDIDIRRLVIHGFVTQNGKLEQLSLIGDVDFPEKQILLASLAQWEFRPASRDGQPTAVEVLLIIPREAV